MELRRTRCHLNTFHEPILEIFEPILEASELVLKWETPEDLPEISVDQQLFMQVLANLIDNAIKYTPDSGTITVSAEISTSEAFEGYPYNFGRTYRACPRYGYRHPTGISTGVCSSVSIVWTKGAPAKWAAQG